MLLLQSVKKNNIEGKDGGTGILEKDIEEKFVRSSGKGGQKVNKTSTCVYPGTFQRRLK
jgi:protein subunit release factor B